MQALRHRCLAVCWTSWADDRRHRLWPLRCPSTFSTPLPYSTGLLRPSRHLVCSLRPVPLGMSGSSVGLSGQRLSSFVMSPGSSDNPAGLSSYPSRLSGRATCFMHSCGRRLVALVPSGLSVVWFACAGIYGHACLWCAFPLERCSRGYVWCLRGGFVLGRLHLTSYIVNMLMCSTIFFGRLPILNLITCHYPEWFELILQPIMSS